jgi:hypothetical protein
LPFAIGHDQVQNNNSDFAFDGGRSPAGFRKCVLGVKRNHREQSKEEQAEQKIGAARMHCSYLTVTLTPEGAREPTFVRITA